MKTLIVTLKHKKTGEETTVTVPLRGSKKHSHITKAILKSSKGYRIIRVVVSG